MEFPLAKQISMASIALKYLTLVMKVMIKKHLLLFFLTMMEILWILVKMLYIDMHKW
jgi:hypothetical protein